MFITFTKEGVMPLIPIIMGSTVVAMILGFVWWWPLGLAVLAFLIARRRYGGGRGPMFAGEEPTGMFDHRMERYEYKMARAQERMERGVARAQDRVERVRSRMERYYSRTGGWFAAGSSSSGNHAFDEYRADTLRRLEDEQREFKDFLDRLRVAKDRAEFDQFMADRRRNIEQESPPPAPPQQG
jgi:Protein of unknown function (DUF2852)